MGNTRKIGDIGSVKDVGFLEFDGSIWELVYDSSFGLSHPTKLYIDGSLAVFGNDIIRIDAYNVIQDVSIALGGGGVTLAYVDGSLNNIRATYVPDASLSSDFEWVGGFLTVNASSGGGVGELVDYATYEPHPGDASIYRTGELVTQIVTENSFGTKVVDFTYDVDDNVIQVDISTYGLATRVVTFEKDVDDNIIAVHVN